MNLELSIIHNKEPQSFWKNNLWTYETNLELLDKKFCQPHVHRPTNEMHNKRTLYLHRNMGEAQLCSGATLLCLTWGILNLFRIQWNRQTIQAYWCKLCYPVSENLVSVTAHGSSNKIMTWNTWLRVHIEWLRTKHWTILEWPFEPWPKSCWTMELKDAVWRRNPSNLRPLEQFALEERTRSPEDRCRCFRVLQTSLDCSGWRKMLCNKIYIMLSVSFFLSRPVLLVLFR